MGLSFAASARIGIAFLKLVNDPTQTDEIFKISRNLRGSKDQRLRDQIVARHLELPGFKELVDERYIPPTPSIEELLSCPKGSFGHEFASHLHRNGLKPDFYDAIEITGVGDYLIMRVRQTHDIWHVILGYDTSVAGELAIQGAYLSQLGDGFAGLLLSAGILHTLKKNPLGYIDTMDLIFDSYHRCKQAAPLITVKWEEKWNVPIEELRKELRIPSQRRQKLAAL